MSDESIEYNPRARAALFQGLKDQLRSPDTPEVKAELNRLLALGIKKEKAKEMMAFVLAVHFVRMMKRKKPFDYPAYLEELRRLPEIDEEQEL